jgi:molybdate/tungstate transport system substrate-binding protein
VIVLTAGSLETIMKTAVDPGFHRATGYTVTDVSGGSTGLAQDIKGGVHQADVFWSAAPTADKTLMGSADGDWVTWYITFATSPLVLGYEPTSKFASTIKSQPWWKVITEPGFLIGRTNPVTDPKGRLAVSALEDAATKNSDPTVGAIATKQTTVYTETSLVGRLQSGQLDAGFFYAVEASAAHFPTVPLTGVSEYASYTLTIVAKAPHSAAADAFVTYLLSKDAKKLLAEHGLKELGKPKLSGKKSAVPKSLRKVIK